MTYSIVPNPTTSGYVLTSQGSGVLPAWQALPTPWVTGLDLDFTAQTTQSLTTDGAKTIAGLTFTKGNSVNETVHAVLTNGTGVVFQPNASAGYPGVVSSGSGARSLPFLWLPLSSVLPAGFDFSVALRIWAYISADNLAASGYGYSALAVDDGPNTASLLQDGYFLQRGYTSANQQIRTYAIGASSNVQNNATATTTQVLGAGNRVVLLDIPALGDFRTRALSGAYSAGWPATSALNITSAGSPQTRVEAMPVGTSPTSFGVLLGAAGDGGGNGASVTFARLRVDYRI
jgi:hypothetical protein